MRWIAIVPFALAFLFSLLTIPLIRRLAFRLGRLAIPRDDRWHKKPTPTLGGLGIVLSIALALLISQMFLKSGEPVRWGFMSGAVVLFFVGLYDEFRPMSPIAKLVAQILAATLVIALGYTSTFFSPRIANPLLAQLPNILFTYVWLVGITNAINLLDNMDGLAAGISLIAALVLGYFFWHSGNISLYWISMALVGSLAGFLVFNFPPASIFMGDSGSLFLGFSLASLAIAQQQQASDVFAVIAAPTLIFLIPILDTTLVMITRMMRGQSPVQGGRDHTSHRLVAFGLSERQALAVLFGVAFVSALMAAMIEALNYWLSLVLVPILILGLSLLTAYLGRLKVVSAGTPSRPGLTIAQIMTDLTVRRRLLEVLLDFFLIGIAYYLAYLGGFGMRMNQLRLEVYLASLPLAFASSYLAFYLSGVYRVVWRYFGFDDLLRYLGAALGGVALFTAGFYFINSLSLAPWTSGFRSVVILYFAIFLFLGLVFSRSSFRVLDTLFRQRIQPDEQLVLVIGAGDSAEMALRWIAMNPQFKYHPVGLIANDPLLRGRYIHGTKVMGDLEQLSAFLTRNKIEGVILADADLDTEKTSLILDTCRLHLCWVRRLCLDFETVQN